jgi:predicted amidohydrolase
MKCRNSCKVPWPGLVRKAAEGGAGLVVLPEAFISGYPAWIWRLRPGGDWGTSEDLHARLLASSADIDNDELTPLCEAARKNNIAIVCGLNERDGRLSRVTRYNTVVIIGDDGVLLNRHRKLMPTNPERMVWGFGDGSGLKVVDTPVGKAGTLLCRENYMPLARYTLYSQGVAVYVAPTYDSGDRWLGTMQHIAREGRCRVIVRMLPARNEIRRGVETSGSFCPVLTTCQGRRPAASRVLFSAGVAMKPVNRMKRVLAACAVPVMLAALPACTSHQVYGAGQNWQRNECNRIPDSQERSRCLDSAATSYEEYQRQRDAARGAE